VVHEVVDGVVDEVVHKVVDGVVYKMLISGLVD